MSTASKKNWETSTTGGPEINAQEAGKLLGVSHTQTLRLEQTHGLRRSVPFNPLRTRQVVKFFLQDVLDLRADPDGFKARNLKPKSTEKKDANLGIPAA